MREITSLDEIKKIELSIMKKIHCICEEENIVYYLSFGTLIGAIRHKGFIPWDDDIDIYVPRTDYDRLIRILKEKGESLNLDYANPFSKVHYGRNLTKVFDTNTVLTEPEYKTDDPIGVFIDLWPLDGTPNNPILRKIYILMAMLKKKLILASSMNQDKRYSKIKNLQIKISGMLDNNKLVQSMERMARAYSFDNSKYVFCYSAQDAIYQKELFDNRILWDFEDSEFYVPVEYDRILRLEFGNYMKLPPEDKRIPHHIINTFYKC